MKRLKVEWECVHGLHVAMPDGSGLHPRCVCPKEPTGVRHFDWLRALAQDAAVEPVSIGYAHRLTLDGFDFATGRQTQPKSLSYLAERFGNLTAWKNALKSLRDRGYLTAYAEVQQGPRATPLYLLTVPQTASPGAAVSVA